MKIVLTIALFISVGWARADDSLLAFDAVYRVIEPSSAIIEGDDAVHNVFKVYVWLYIKNISRGQVKVSTRCRSNVDREKRRVIFDMQVVPDKNPLGLNTIVAESDLSVVTLQPGEITIVKEVDLVKVKPIDEVMVGYTVDTTMATRYGLWMGSVRLVARDVDGALQTKSKAEPKAGKAKPKTSSQAEDSQAVRTGESCPKTSELPEDVRS